MAQATDITDTERSEASAEQVVRAALAALDRGDLSAMREHYSPDVVEDLVPVGMLRGPDEIMSFFGELLAAVAELEVTVTRVVPGERELGVEWRMRGSFSGAPFQGIEPTGRPIEMRGFDLFEVEDGLIVGNTAYYDGAEFARQVGLLPAQDSGAERALKGAFNAVTKLRTIVGERTGT